MTGTDYYYAGLCINLITILIAIPLASYMGESFQKKHPELKPYKWGYFTGWMGVLNGIGVVILACILLYLETYDYYPNNHDLYVLLLVLGIIAAISGTFILKRNKWGWVVGLIMQFNLIMWIINGIYLKNRWSELSGPSFKTIGVDFIKKPLAIRVLVVGSAFWLVVVLAFVYVFEPYGGYTSNQDKWQVAKVIVFPPLVAVIGYFLYTKVIRPKNVS
ncbi:MAG: hypothetical protein WCC11_08715 [Gammaproteobacteria bacterium]